MAVKTVHVCLALSAFTIILNMNTNIIPEQCQRAFYALNDGAEVS